MRGTLHSDRRWRTWLLLFAGWTAIGLFFSLQSWLSYAVRGNEVHVLRTFIFRLSHWYAWGLLTPLILYWSRRYPIERLTDGKTLRWHVLAALVLAPVQVALGIGMRMAGFYVFNELPTDQIVAMAANLSDQLLISSFNGIVTYGVIVGIYHAVTYYKQFREREVRASQLEAQVAQAQLMALKMQLQPHFLFNTLNSISALVTDNPAAAERMIARLSELLRATLENAGTQDVSLQQELAFLETYLEIERARFPDRLQVDMDIAPDVLDARVPNLILQPLVENAIRHGIAPQPHPGTVAIHAARSNGHLMLRVQDNGAGVHALEGLQWGVGLSNTQARLKQLYGAEHTFELRNSNGFEVQLAFPYQTTN